MKRRILSPSSSMGSKEGSKKDLSVVKSDMVDASLNKNILPKTPDPSRFRRFVVGEQVFQQPPISRFLVFVDFFDVDGGEVAEVISIDENDMNDIVIADACVDDVALADEHLDDVLPFDLFGKAV